MAERNKNPQAQNKKAAQKRTGYRFPESEMKHVGPYGVNDHPASLREFEISQRANNRQVKRQKELERQKRRKKRTLIAVICAAALILLIGGGVLAAKLLFPKMPDEEIVPVATTEAPAEQSDEPVTEIPEEEPVAEENEVTEETGGVYPADTDSSYYQVINRSYPIPANYIAGTGELVSVEGKQMESNAGQALKEMVAALRSTGMDIIVQSGYRTDGDQEYLYNRQIGRQGGDKYKAGTISAVPLTSEHQAGLAVDLSTDGTLLETFASTEQGKWLKAHCAEFGYILRYPPDKETVTGIIHEPWHFRYVGSPDLAAKIMNSGKCMEEYFNKYLNQEDIEPYLPYLQ